MICVSGTVFVFVRVRMVFHALLCVVLCRIVLFCAARCVASCICRVVRIICVCARVVLRWNVVCMNQELLLSCCACIMFASCCVCAVCVLVLFLCRVACVLCCVCIVFRVVCVCVCVFCCV